jgi:hypothetical protein
MMDYALTERRRGRPIYAIGGLCVDLRLGSPTYGEEWADGRITKLEDCLELGNALVLLDELHEWWPAHKWRDLSDSARRFLRQHRKDGLDILYTTQYASGVVNVVRELTAELWHCWRWGPLINQFGEDPQREDKKSKRLGYKVKRIKPEVFEIYDTALIVGSDDGSGYGRGVGARYAAQARRGRYLVRIDEAGAAGPRYEWFTGSLADALSLGHVMPVRRQGPGLVEQVRKKPPKFLNFPFSNERAGGAGFVPGRPLGLFEGDDCRQERTSLERAPSAF